jgi:hypothetical protein
MPRILSQSSFNSASSLRRRRARAVSCSHSQSSSSSSCTSSTSSSSTTQPQTPPLASSSIVSWIFGSVNVNATSNQEETIPGMIAMSRKSSVETMTSSASCSSLLSSVPSCQDSSSLDHQQQERRECESSQEDSAWGHFLDVERADADLTKHSRILTAQERRHYQHQQANNRMLCMVPVQFQ